MTIIVRNNMDVKSLITIQSYKYVKSLITIQSYKYVNSLFETPIKIMMTLSHVVDGRYTFQ